ncbi:MAG: glycosyltransferase family 4 protein [Acidobacteria bacterium]|nr:glycosyltransferase family 4 protein [Acidobacteriota bacterium]
MKIGVDASCWSNRRGFGRFTREIVSALLEKDRQTQYILLIDQQSLQQSALPAHIPRIAVSTRQSSTAAASAEGHRTLSDMLRMSCAAAKARCDLFFFPAVYSYFPLPPGPKCVVTFHDNIAERHPNLIFPGKRARLFWRWKSWLARHRADRILTVSAHSRQTLIEEFGITPDQIEVIPEAASPIFRPVRDPLGLASVLKRFDLPATARYLIYVGGISPHKNLEFLIGAFDDIIREPCYADTKLLLVGDYERDVFHSSFPGLQKLAESSRWNRSVIFTAYVTDHELLQLYNGALALVLPSVEEGFGLPAVEAMACGTPVVVSNAGALPEVAGEAGLYFDPHDRDDLKNTLLRILNDPQLRHDLAARSRERSLQFSWTRAAEVLMAIFRQIVAS